MGFNRKTSRLHDSQKVCRHYTNVYKDTFDLENKLKNSNRTYRELEFEPTLDDVL